MDKLKDLFRFVSIRIPSKVSLFLILKIIIKKRSSKTAGLIEVEFKSERSA